MSISGIGSNAYSSSVMERMKPPDASEMKEKILSKFDEDGDGALSSVEISKSGKKSSEILKSDTNGDGSIDSDELLNGIQKKLEEHKNRPPTGIPPEDGEGRALKGPPPDIQGMKQQMIQMGSDEMGTEESSGKSTEELLQEFMKKLGMSDEDSQKLLSLMQNTQLDIKA